MMGQYVADRVADELRTSGEAMTLTRPGGAAVVVKGKRYATEGTSGDPIAGMAAQKTLRIKIGNAEIAAAGWPGPPRNGDLLLLAGRPYRVMDDADTRTHDGVTIAHFLTVKGGP